MYICKNNIYLLFFWQNNNDKIVVIIINVCCCCFFFFSLLCFAFHVHFVVNSSSCVCVYDKKYKLHRNNKQNRKEEGTNKIKRNTNKKKYSFLLNRNQMCACGYFDLFSIIFNSQQLFLFTFFTTWFDWIWNDKFYYLSICIY